MADTRTKAKLVKLRHGSIRDLDDCVNLHHVCMPDALITRLGSKVVKAYFRSILLDPHCTCLLVEFPESARICGRIILRKSSRTRNANLLDLWKTSVIAIVQRPNLIWNVLFESWSNRGGLPQATALIEYVYVHPQARGRGLGHELLVETTKESARVGARWVCTKTANARLAKHYEIHFGAHVVRRNRGFGGGTTSLVLVWPTTSMPVEQ